MFTDLILFDIGKSPFDISYKTVQISSLGNHKKADLVIIRGNEINRNILENKTVDVLLSPEYGIKKDSLHFRNSGLNQVLCTIAHKNNIAIGFSFSDILNSSQRSLVLGRMMQNVRLCRKFKVSMLIASFASNEYEFRSHDSLRAFGLVIGMSPDEVNKALSLASKIGKR